MFIKRTHYLQKIEKEFEIHPIVGLLGPRQCGKTTLAKRFQAKHKPAYLFDLEDPDDLAALENPKMVLESLDGLIIIDEIQRRPGLFPYLRTLADKKKTQILILGSASRDLINQSSESLAGRIGYVILSPFSLDEVKTLQLRELWLKGGFPRSFLTQSDQNSYRWRKAYISTFLERDIPNLGIKIPATTLRRFWLMLAHYHGQILNCSELGKSFGIADTTVRHYIDILTDTFMVRQLQPWIGNLKKRQIKSPKLYIKDSGIFHTLQGIETYKSLLSHPKLGASWEGFALETVLSHFSVSQEDVYFWGVHSQCDLDLYFRLGSKKIGVEFKFTDQPQLSAEADKIKSYLKLNHLYYIYPGKKVFKLAKDITACGLSLLHNL